MICVGLPIKGKVSALRLHTLNPGWSSGLWSQHEQCWWGLICSLGACGCWGSFAPWPFLGPSRKGGRLLAAASNICAPLMTPLEKRAGGVDAEQPCPSHLLPVPWIFATIGLLRSSFCTQQRSDSTGESGLLGQPHPMKPGEGWFACGHRVSHCHSAGLGRASSRDNGFPGRIVETGQR